MKKTTERKIIKRLTAIGLIVVLFAALLTGCSAAPKSDAATSDTGAAYEESADSSSEESIVLESADSVYMDEAAKAYDYPSDYYYPNDSFDTESYLSIYENGATSTLVESMTTFSLKVDTASYDNVARYIQDGMLPPSDAVRTEEMINYFSYDEAVEPISGTPFGIYTEVGKSPFDSQKYLAFIRVKTKDVDVDTLPPSNLVFLIDTSGSMDSYDKLPLLQQAFEMLAANLTDKDRVSIVTYAGTSEVVLEGVRGSERQTIQRAVDSLMAGGSTAGADGINTAYSIAEDYFIKGGNNRVILATDGDFNVGISDLDGLNKLITKKRDSGIYLSVLGFGTGNLQDATMETLAKNGNGNYSYIRSIESAHKVLIEEMAANLYTVADDVKAQVEFNPENVTSYRLIGYENRQLQNNEFKDDTVDAGEIGAGTDVVAIFEIELKGASGGVDYKYEEQADAKKQAEGGEYSDELFEVRIRYKDPGESESKQITKPVKLDSIKSNNSSDFEFASAVAMFASILRNSYTNYNVDYSDVIEKAESNLGKDEKGYRTEFVTMVEFCNARYGN
jgi:Ca-activated chloride channel family protein